MNATIFILTGIIVALIILLFVCFQYKMIDAQNLRNKVENLILRLDDANRKIGSSRKVMEDLEKNGGVIPKTDWTKNKDLQDLQSKMQ